MKKILSFIAVFLLAILLVACNKPSEDDPFNLDEKDAVELSSTEIINLITSLDQEQIFNNIFKMTFEGSFEEDEYKIYAEETNHFVLSGSGEGEFYVNLTDQIEDAVILFKGAIEFEQTSQYGGVENGAGNYVFEESYSESAGGSFEVFLLNTYAYFNVQAEMKNYEEGVLVDSEELSVKERLEEAITQEMYEMIKDPFSLLFGMVDLGSTLDEINFEDFDEVLDQLPKIKAYKDGNKYSLLIEFNKQMILDNFEDAVIEIANAADFPQPTSAEIQEALDAVDEALEELSFKYLIVIENNKILNMSLDVKVVIYLEEDINDFYEGEYTSKATRTLELKFEISTEQSNPTLPTDLDDYEIVEVPSIFN